MLSDGTGYKTEPIQGERGTDGVDGEDGNGIDSVFFNPDYTLTINFTDGTSYTTGVIRGEKG